MPQNFLNPKNEILRKSETEPEEIICGRALSIFMKAGKNHKSIFWSVFFCFFSFLWLPHSAFAIDQVITSWSSPAADSSYPHDQHVLYNGVNWTLPPDYLAIIRYVIDGAVVHIDTIDSFGAVSQTNGTLPPWDAGSTITKTWNTPNWDQSPGVHLTGFNTLISPKCAVENNCSFPLCTSPGVPAGCQFAQTLQTMTKRNYTIEPAPFPVMQIGSISSFSVTEGNSQNQTVSVGNSGNLALSGVASIVGGDGNNNFYCVPSCSYTVNPGFSVPITIKFWPPDGSGGTTFDGNVEFTCTNCVPGSTVTKALTGNSVQKAPPAISLYWGGTNNPLPATVDFGLVSINTTKDVLIRVKNTGSSQGGKLSGDISFSPDTGQYSCPLASNPCSSVEASSNGCSYTGLDANQYCDIKVRFGPTNPPSPGWDEPTVTFSNTVVGAPGKVSRDFSGFGNDKPILQVTAMPPPNTLCVNSIGVPTTVNPASCNLTTNGTFVNVEHHKDITFLVKNIGADLMSGELTIPPSDDFTCESGCSYGTLSSSDAPWPVVLRFKPKDGGPCSDLGVPCGVTLSFANRDSGGNTVSTFPISISANGNNAPSFSTGGALDEHKAFGNVLVGDYKNQSPYVLRIANAGVGDMTVEITTPAGDFTCIVPADCSSFVVAEDASQNVNYKFSPSSNGAKSTTINVVAKDNGGNIVADKNYILTGTGIVPNVSVTPISSAISPIDYGIVNIGDTSPVKSYTITNKSTKNDGNLGPDNKIIYSILDSSHFHCNSGCSGTLAAWPSQQSSNFQVYFEPGTDTSDAVIRNEMITFSSSSVPIPSLTGSKTGYVKGQGNDQPRIQVTPIAGTSYGTIDVNTIGDGKNLGFEVKNIGLGSFGGSVVDDTTGLDLSGVFICSSGCSYNLSPTDPPWPVSLRFEPTSDGFISKAVRFQGAQDAVKTISGTGNLIRSVTATLSSGSLNFGTIKIGDPLPTAIMNLENAGPGDWKGEVSVERPFKVALPCDDGTGRCIYNIPANSSKSITLEFDPQVEGEYNSHVGFSGRTNTIAYFPFDKEDILSSGKTRDASGNKSDGTFVNGATITSVGSGRFGEALSLNGTNQYIQVSDNPNLRISRYTVSTWIYPNGVPNEPYKGIVGKPGRNYNVWLNSSGYIHHRFHSTGGGFDDGAPSTPVGSIQWNQWNHVIITNDGMIAKTYINGVEKASGPVNGSLVVDNTTLFFGKNLDGGGGNYFKGLIDETEIFDRAITPAEVARLALESDKSKTFNKSLLAKLRRLAVNTAEATGETSPDKLRVAVSGTATFKPVINIGLPTSDFGKVRVNTSKDITFRFSNTGSGEFGPGTLSITPPFYCVETRDDQGSPSDPSCGYDIAPNTNPLCPDDISQCPYFDATIRFLPTVKGNFSRDLNFNNPSFAITLTGEGVLMRFQEF